MMSTRSKREHKPTSKFLKYYNDEIVCNKTVRKSLPKNDTPPPATNRKRKIELEEGNNKNTPSVTPTKILKCEAATSSEVRRSVRQTKPNERLKIFPQDSLNSSKAGEHGLYNDHSVKLLKPNVIEENNFKIINIRRGNGEKSKKVASVSPMVRTESISMPVISTKHLTIGLSDCVKNCEDFKVSQLALKREETKGAMDCNKEHKSNLAEQEKSSINPSDKFYGKMRVIANRSKSKTGVISKIGPITGKIKKNEADKKVFGTRSYMCESSSATALDKNNSIRLTRNKLVVNKDNADAEKVDNVRKIKQPYTANKALAKPSSKVATSNIRNKSSSNKSLETSLNNKTSKIATKTQAASSTQKDIKDTLHKFLLMGHKVANAISETLKTNEVELLSKSSTFEKKCINLVQSVANTSSDISEDDMETILKCLDEEQEERRSYRRTFLESLKVAHLTNMALYSQMIRVLHTL